MLFNNITKPAYTKPDMYWYWCDAEGSYGTLGGDQMNYYYMLKKGKVSRNNQIPYSENNVGGFEWVFKPRGYLPFRNPGPATTNNFPITEILKNVSFSIGQYRTTNMSGKGGSADKILEYDYKGAWPGKAKMGSVELSNIKQYFRIENFGNVDEALFAHNNLKSYVYGSDIDKKGDPSYLKKIDDELFSLTDKKKFLPSKLALSSAVKYGDKIKITSMVSKYTLYGAGKPFIEDASGKTGQVFGSHEDTQSEYDKIYNLIAPSEQQEEYSWFIIKGPHSDADAMNATIGTQVKSGDIIRLEHVKTGRNLSIDDQHTTLGALFYQTENVLSPKALLTENAGTEEVRNKSASAKFKDSARGLNAACNAVLSSSTSGIGSINDEFYIKIIDADIPKLTNGCKFYLEHKNTGRVLVSEYAHYVFYKDEVFDKSKFKYWYGLVNLIKLSADEKVSMPWIVLAIDSFNPQENKELINKVSSFDTDVKTTIAYFCNGILKDPTTNYFGQGINLTKKMPTLDTDELLTSYLTNFLKYLKSLDDDFFNKNKFTINPIKAVIRKVKTTNTTFANSLNKIDEINNYLQQNSYFQSRSLREKIQEIEGIISSGTTSELSSLESKISTISSDRVMMMAKTGFAAINELLNATQEPGDASTGIIGATIMIQWLEKRANTLTAIDPSTNAPLLSSEKISRIKTDLASLESSIYVEASASNTISQGNLAKKINYLETINALKSKGSIIDSEKTSLIEAFRFIVANKSLFTITELSDLKVAFTLVTQKFSLGVDAGGIAEGLNTVFDVNYLVAQFNIMEFSLRTMTAGDKITSTISTMLDYLKKIISRKAEFDKIAGSEASTNLDAFVGSTNLVLLNNQALATYQNSITALNDTNFKYLLYQLKVPLTTKDFVNYFESVSQQSTLSSNHLSGLQKALTLINGENSTLSSADVRRLQKAMEQIKIISGSTFTPPSPKITSFTNFLDKISAKIINADYFDKTNVNWKSEKILAFWELLYLVQAYNEYNPDFSNEKQKYQFAAIIKYFMKVLKTYQKDFAENDFEYLLAKNNLESLTKIFSSVKK